MSTVKIPDHVKQQQAEIQRLREQILYLENIIGLMPGHVYWLDQNNVFLGCNNLQAKDAGLSSRREIVGKTNYDLPWGKNAAELNRINDLVMKTGKSQIVEEPGMMADGKISLYLSEKVPLRDTRGNIIGLLGISLNITGRKKMEIALKKEKERADKAEKEKIEYLAHMNEALTGQKTDKNQSIEEYANNIRDYLENIIALMPPHIYWHNRHGIILGCNDSQAKDAGFATRKDVIGKTVYDLLPKEQADIIHRTNMDVIRVGKNRVTEEYGTNADGTTSFYLSNKAPLRNKQGKIIGLLGVSFDITKRKKIEEELKQAKEHAEIANKIKNEFLYNMRHDIRTPFNGILGFTKRLLTKETDQKKKIDLNYIVESAQKLLDYLNEILEFVHVESNQMPVLLKKFDPKKLIDEITHIFMPTAKDKNLTFSSHHDPKIPKILMGDQMRLHRILINLVSNALKFTNHGGVTITTKLAKQEKNRVIIKIIVKDTGIGIPKDKYNFIFEQFSRLTSSYSGIYKGIGLGLRVVKQFIEELDGDIEVQSEEALGSRFICILPFKIPLLDK